MNIDSFTNAVKSAIMTLDNDWEKAFMLSPVDPTLDFSASTFMKWLEKYDWPLQSCCMDYLEANPEAKLKDTDTVLTVMNRLKETITSGYADVIYKKCSEPPVAIDECVNDFVFYCSFMNFMDSIYQNIIAHQYFTNHKVS